MQEDSNHLIQELNDLLYFANREMREENPEDAIRLYTNIQEKHEVVKIWAEHKATEHIEEEEIIHAKTIQAKDLYKKGRYEEAIELWQEVIEGAKQIQRGE